MDDGESSKHATPRPIILITGANAGLGFATCQRLLLQLSSTRPSDTLAKCQRLSDSDEEALPTPFTAPHGCTLILACRNAIKAHKARNALKDLLRQIQDLPDEAETPDSADALQKLGVARPTGAKATLNQDEPEDLVKDEKEAPQVASQLRQRRGPSSHQSSTSSLSSEAKSRGKYRRRFCRGTKIEFVSVDLGSFASVLHCAKEVSERHSHLTHLILNAGGAAWGGLDWLKATWMILTSFKAALTYPTFKIQRSGDLSQDGIGWVWSINVGGSWMLAQALLPLLRQSPYHDVAPSRIIWTSSIEAFRKHYDDKDKQCLRTDVPSKAYESTKFQCELAALALSTQLEQRDSAQKQPQVFLTHPGVVATSIMADWLNWFTATAMLWSFYLARWVCSPHHCVSPYKGSIATTFACLAPTADRRLAPAGTGTRYGSRCDFWGREYVYLGDHIDTWSKADDEGLVQEGGVRALAKDWLAETEKICRKVRRDSDTGRLPPGQRPFGKAGSVSNSGLVGTPTSLEEDKGVPLGE